MIYSFFLKRFKDVVSLLKICEVALESVPQLATQWTAIYLEEVNKNFGVVSPLQYISITSSTITIVLSIVSWVARNRRKQWIHPEYPPAASLLPLACLALAAILSGTVSFKLLHLIWFPSTIMDDIGSSRMDALFRKCLYIVLPFSTIFTIFVIIMPCKSNYNGRCWKATLTLVHICLSSILPTICFYLLASCFSEYEFKGDHVCAAVNIQNVGELVGYSLFVFIMFCLIMHFLLGIIVFSGLNVARVITPIIKLMVSFMRILVNRCPCCPKQWKIAINDMLDDLVKVERENQMTVEMEGGERSHMIESQNQSIEMTEETRESDSLVSEEGVTEQEV